MPTVKKCAHSGALIFDLTDEEAEQKETIEKVKSLEKEVAELKALIAQSGLKGGD